MTCTHCENPAIVRTKETLEPRCLDHAHRVLVVALEEQR